MHSPAEVRQRVGALSRRPLMLLVNARKRAHQDDPFAITPQQSDYVAQWGQVTAACVWPSWLILR